MLLNALLLRSQRLDKAILEGRLPTYEEMETFLDGIIDAAQRCVTPNQLDSLCTLYRKWKTITNHLHNERYTRSIDKASQHFKMEDIALDISDLGKTTGKLRSNAPLMLLDVLSGAIDPYHAFYKEAIRNIDPEYYQKQTNEGKLKDGTDAFKRGELEKAERLYADVVNAVVSREDLDYNHLFQLSWSLHGLGNIEMIGDRLRSALQLYKASYEIKILIPNLPKLFLLSTQAKILAARQIDVSASGWFQDLKEFYVVFLHEKKETQKSNRLWTQNLEEDITYYTGKSLYYLNDRQGAISKFDNAIRIALSCEDFPGLLRARFWRGAMSVKWGNYVSSIAQTLSAIPPERKKNPYLRRIISEPNLQEVSLLNADYAESIKEVFGEASIEPLPEVPESAARSVFLRLHDPRAEEE